MVTPARLAHPVGVIGAGLVGLAVARQLAQSQVPVVVFEKEATVARHQSGRNSGVVHAGIYYLPGSAKALMCRRGVELLQAYCADRSLPWDARGKLVVARNEAETAKLREIERRAAANGVPGVRWLDAAAIRELEPDIAGQAALLSPTTAVVDYPAIARSFSEDVTRLGGQCRRARRCPVSTGRATRWMSSRPPGRTGYPGWSSALACRRTCSPSRPATRPRRRSSPSAASTCGCDRTRVAGCGTSSIPCRTPPTRSSAST